MRIQTYWCPKQGSTDREYEDAIAVSAHDGFPHRFAVADGASESSFARLWAELLVRSYADGLLMACALPDGLQPIQSCWRDEVASRPLPWYAAEKARSGAFAALAGLTLNADGTWQALASGDCCVMHVRADRLQRSFPLESAAAFDNRPRLLSSNPERNAGLHTAVAVTVGRWQPGDSFLLASDALAAYLLRRVVDEGRTVGRAIPFRRPHTFRRWADSRRAERALRNDDLSLLRVQL
jgi:hypothetical protein